MSDHQADTPKRHGPPPKTHTKNVQCSANG